MSSDSEEDVIVPKKPRAAGRTRLKGKARPVSPSSGVYTSCVSRCFQSHNFQEEMKRIQAEDTDDDIGDDFFSGTSKEKTTLFDEADSIVLSDDEDDHQNIENQSNNASSVEQDTLWSPSPPPPPAVSRKSRRKQGDKVTKLALSAVNKLKQDLDNARNQLKLASDVNDPQEMVVIVPDDDEEEDLVTIRVDIKGTIQRYQLGLKEVFTSVYGLIASQYNVAEKQVMLVHKDRTLLHTDTPQSVNLETFEIITGHILTEEPLNDSISYSPDDDVIELVLQTRGSKRKEQMKLPRDKPLLILMKQYASKVKLDLDNIQFRFDGELLSQSDTPADLEMDDGDVIDVNVTGVMVIS